MNDTQYLDEIRRTAAQAARNYLAPEESTDVNIARNHPGAVLRLLRIFDEREQRLREGLPRKI